MRNFNLSDAMFLRYSIFYGVYLWRETVLDYIRTSLTKYHNLIVTSYYLDAGSYCIIGISKKCGMGLAQ